MKAYAGIGSRETPLESLEAMNDFAFAAGAKLVLRSGGADGADSAFEAGARRGNGQCEIFLPWKGFNKNTSPLFEVNEKAFVLAESVHPRAKFMRRPVKLLIARNMHQILGKNLDDPVEFVVCWTPDGCESHETYGLKTGGTGSAIALASKCGVPVYNLYNPTSLQAALEHFLLRV
jgi:hypothetical protein